MKKNIFEELLKEISFRKIQKKFDNEVGQQKRMKYEISLDKIDDKAKNDIEQQKMITEFEKLSVSNKTIDVIKEKDKQDLILFEFFTRTRENNNKHRQIVTFELKPILEMYKQKGKITKSALTTKNDTETFCDCESYKYHFSKINKKRDSFYYGRKNKDKLNYSVKGVRPSPNPRWLGGLCKHLRYDFFDIDKNVNQIIKKISDLIDQEGLMDEDEFVNPNYKKSKKKSKELYNDIMQEQEKIKNLDNEKIKENLQTPYKINGEK